jgi:hypothetical protein
MTGPAIDYSVYRLDGLRETAEAAAEEGATFAILRIRTTVIARYVNSKRGDRS